MLRVLSIAGILGAALLLLVCALVLRQPRAAVSGRYPLLERLLLWAAGLSLVALALSGFSPRLLERPLAGHLLLFHVGCGALLAAAATLTLLLAGSRYGFETACETGAGPCGVCCPAHRVIFWLLAVAVLGVVVTPLASMLPLFGTCGMETLLTCHRVFGLVTLLLASCYAYGEAQARQAKG